MFIWEIIIIILNCQKLGLARAVQQKIKLPLSYEDQIKGAEGQKIHLLQSASDSEVSVNRISIPHSHFIFIYSFKKFKLKIYLNNNPCNSHQHMTNASINTKTNCYIAMQKIFSFV